MQTCFIVHTPGLVPRLGYPIGNVCASLRNEWIPANPDAAIYVMEWPEGASPVPGNASVSTAEEYLAINTWPSRSKSNRS